ncbi:cold-shock protein [Endozoicomonas acroporae]|uniref:cold-shock protein n=1 Tax=Endozoicomonas acroporae TaxID=1701104 RepID=UPI003D78C506
MSSKTVVPVEHEYHLGTVKWFGGYNAKTEGENNFGFLTSNTFGDVYVHKNAIKCGSALYEGRPVLFTQQSGKKGVSASTLYGLPGFTDELSVIFEPLAQFLTQDINRSGAAENKPLSDLITEIFNSEQQTVPFIKQLARFKVPLSDLVLWVARSRRTGQLFREYLLAGNRFAENLKQFGLQHLPTEYVDENIQELADYFASLDESGRLQELKRSGSRLSFSAVLYLLFNQLAPHPEHWEEVERSHSKRSHTEALQDFICKIVLREKTDIQPFVREAYKSCFEDGFKNFNAHPVIKPIITPLLVKRKIYLRDMSFVDDVREYPALSADPEFWFLALILPLINPVLGNKPADLEKFVLHELWQWVLRPGFDVDHPSWFALFPQCQTLELQYRHMKLSCEAFHWQPKEGERRFLCRSKTCHDPQVLPDLEQCYLDFSAFDWLAHYGMNYDVESQPSKRDFAIKLAGCFNRIRELHTRLHCRCCKKVMVPNMKYARVEVATLDPHTCIRIVTPVQAAYRLTVFKCNDERCAEYNKSHYINHCIHYKCNEIIDSRDLEDKCSEGRYICSECHSCCHAHTSNNQTQDERFANPELKHQRLYQDSPSFRPTTGFEPNLY